MMRVLRFRMKRDDHVGHRHRLALARLLAVELLQFDLGAEFLEVLLDDVLLFGHLLGAADARAEGAEIFQILHGPFAVEWDGFDFHRFTVLGKTHGGALLLGFGAFALVAGAVG